MFSFKLTSGHGVFTLSGRETGYIYYILMPKIHFNCLLVCIHVYMRNIKSAKDIAAY